MSRPLRILLAYNEPLKTLGEMDAESEAGVLDSVAAIERALLEAGHSPVRIGLTTTLEPLIQRLRDPGFDVAFNLVESFRGRPELESAIAGLFDLHDLPYTGSSAECLGLVRNKARTKLALLGAGVPTAEAWVIEPEREILREVADALAAGPLFVKPACTDASEGVLLDSVVENEVQLATQVRRVHERYGAALVERFIDGRELNVGIIDLGEPVILPLAEMEFELSDELPWKVITYNAKWRPDSPEDKKTQVRCPANIDVELAGTVRRVALAAYRAVGARDYARVDIRVDRHELPYVLEVNGNPDLDPQVGLARELRAAGWTYEQFIVRLVEHAASRRSSAPQIKTINGDLPTEGPVRISSKGGAGLAIRTLLASDLPALVALTAATAVFRPDEVEVAEEILRESLLQPHAADGYRVLVAEWDGRPVGWSCHGRVPLTDGSFDLYWIVVESGLQGRGVGGQLLEQVEREIQQLRGRWVFAETSSVDSYEPTRAFYRKCGFTVERQTPDFYREGDGLVVFGKRL